MRHAHPVPPRAVELPRKFGLVYRSADGANLTRINECLVLAPKMQKMCRTKAPSRPPQGSPAGGLRKCGRRPVRWQRNLRACVPWATQLTKRLRFGLADALACHAKYLSYLFECVLRGAADAELHAYDALLTGR